MSFPYLSTNNIDEELERLIQKYTKAYQSRYEYCLVQAHSYEQEGNDERAKKCLKQAAECKEILDTPSAIWREAKTELMMQRKRLSRKDNSPLSFDDSRSHKDEYCRNRIRVPKLRRKTAWKRFYKIFPHLKGRENLWDYDSLIKLKRYEFVPKKKQKRRKK